MQRNKKESQEVQSRLKKFVSNTIAEIIKEGGTLVEEEEKNRRLEICKGCPKRGTVNPLPFLKMEGCLVCSCPLITKTALKTVVRIKGKEEESITAKEVFLKVISKKENKVEAVVSCPLNFW